MEEEARLSFVVCAACLLFISGQCSCFSQPGGPRSSGHCHDCKCVIVRYAMQKKKFSPKALFHTHPNKTCACSIPCKIDGSARCEQKKDKYKRIAYHAKCRELWKPCDHLAKVAEQLKEYSGWIDNFSSGDIIVPVGCVPLIGYEKRKSTNIKVNSNRDFLRDRLRALQSLRAKKELLPSRLSFKKKQYERKRIEKHNKPLSSASDKALSNIGEDMDTAQETEIPRILWEIPMQKYFSLSELIFHEDESKVSFARKRGT